MADDTTAAENKANADEIKHADAVQENPRGNIHSEPEPAVEQDAPPPLPN